MAERLPTPEEVDDAMRRIDGLRTSIETQLPRNCPKIRIRNRFVRLGGPTLHFDAQNIKEKPTHIVVTCKSNITNNKVCTTCPLNPDNRRLAYYA